MTFLLGALLLAVIIAGSIWAAICALGQPRQEVEIWIQKQKERRERMAVDAPNMANYNNVVSYLVKEYEIDEDAAKVLCLEHKPTIDESEEMSAMAYWPGDKIAVAAKLTPREEVDDLDDDDEEKY